MILIVRIKSFIRRIKKKEFGIIIQDGGTSYIKIKYCPFCGKKLKKKTSNEEE